MTAQQEQGVDLDALRRRLYRADATDADRRRYLEARDARAEPAPSPPAAVPAVRRSRGRIAGAIAVAAITVGALVVATHLPRTAAVPAARPALPVPDARAVLQDIGGGQLLAVDPDQISGPTRTATMVDGTAAAVQRYEGVGNGIVPVALPGAELGSRSVVVAVYSDTTSTITWRALRPAFRQDWSWYQQLVGQGRVTSRVDSATPSGFSYAGSPPVRIAVEAPAGLHWTLLVSAATGATSALH